MTSWHKTGAHPFYIGMYIHIYTHIYMYIKILLRRNVYIFFCVTKSSSDSSFILQITKPKLKSFDGHLPFTKAQTWRLYEPPLPMWSHVCKAIRSPSLEFVVHISPFLKAFAKFTSSGLLSNFHTMHSLEPCAQMVRNRKKELPNCRKIKSCW